MQLKAAQSLLPYQVLQVRPLTESLINRWSLRHNRLVHRPCRLCEHCQHCPRSEAPADVRAAAWVQSAGAVPVHTHSRSVVALATVISGEAGHVITCGVPRKEAHNTQEAQKCQVEEQAKEQGHADAG